jgi:hypothetical protein
MNREVVNWRSGGPVAPPSRYPARRRSSAVPVAGTIVAVLGIGVWYNDTHPVKVPGRPAAPAPKVITHTVIRTVTVHGHPALSGADVVLIVGLIAAAVCFCVWAARHLVGQR